MSENSYPIPPFSIILNDIKYEKQDLENLGEIKIAEMRESFIAGKSFYKQLTGWSLLPTFIGVGSTILHPQDGPFFAIAGAALISNLVLGYNAIKYNLRAKKADQAIAVVTQDITKAKFASTKDTLVDAGQFQVVKRGIDSTYTPVPA